MTTPSQERWERLGGMLIQRRVELDARYRNRTAFAADTGLNWRLLYDIEKAARTNFPADTLAEIEIAYRLPQGSIRNFLDHVSDTLIPRAEPRRRFEEPALQRIWDENEGKLPDDVLLGALTLASMLLANHEGRRSA
jgi:hypothetical protein